MTWGGPRGGTCRRLVAVLALVAAAQMGLASARACEVSLVVLIDVSQSARLAASRLRDALGQTLGSLFTALPATARIGMMTFGTNVTWRVPLGPVRELSTTSISEVSALRFDDAWTDLLTPLLNASDAIAPANASGAVLLISDGVISLPLGRAAEVKDETVLRSVVVPAFAARGARIFGLAIPSPGEELVLDLARRTGGVGLKLDVDADLAALGREIAARLCASESAHAADKRPPGPADRMPATDAKKPAAVAPPTPSSVPDTARRPPSPAASSPPASVPTATSSKPPSAPAGTSGASPRPPSPPLAGGTGPGVATPGGVESADAGSRWSWAGGALTVFGSGLAGAALAAFLRRRRPVEVRAEGPGPLVDVVLPEPVVAAPSIVPRVFDDARTAATELSADAMCADHPRTVATWNCASCRRPCCDVCPKSSHKPPRCERCARPAPSVQPDAVGHLVFVVVWNEARAKVLKKCEMSRENESVEVFGRASALAPLDAPPPMGGRLRMVVERDGKRVVVIDETPPGGFYDLGDGQVLRPGDRLKNNQRFQWHRDGRVFEVVYK